MRIRVCLAGATGWAGSSLAKAIFKAEDLELVGAVSRTHMGKKLGTIIGVPELTLEIHGSVGEVLKGPCDVFVEYTKPTVAKDHVLAALDKGAHVVIGTSGIPDRDYEEISERAITANRGVLAVGNFAVTAVLLQKFAEVAAKYVSHWEVIDFANSSKIDAPSGTARELANRLGRIRESALDIPLGETKGEVESRGARMNGTQVHSVRLPGYVLAVEAVFGMPDQKLILRHEAGSSSEPYVDGALLAIRKVGTFVGLKRGLDSVMDFELA